MGASGEAQSPGFTFRAQAHQKQGLHPAEEGRQGVFHEARQRKLPKPLLDACEQHVFCPGLDALEPAGEQLQEPEELNAVHGELGLQRRAARDERVAQGPQQREQHGQHDQNRQPVRTGHLDKVDRCALCCNSVRGLSWLHEGTELLLHIAILLPGTSAHPLLDALEERQCTFDPDRSCQQLHDWGEQIHEKDGEDQRLEDVLQVDEHAAHAEGGAANQ